jgi:polyisoprenoid-binding protein YceI
MKISKHLSPLILSVLTLMTLSAEAQQKLLPAQSDIGFTFKQMGVPVDGRFKKFDAQVNFDAAKLATSVVTFTIDIASATLGTPEIDAELPKAPWFNTAKFPQATFASSAFKSLGAGKYEVSGKLSVKGQSQQVVVPLSMTQVGANTIVAGVFPIKRLAFKIGENEWADTSMVADDVQVKFKLTLSGFGKLL